MCIYDLLYNYAFQAKMTIIFVNTTKKCIITNIFALTDLGVISPYPTVVLVVIVK